MKQATMKIQKGDVPVILLSALGGFLLVFFSLVGENLGTAVFVGLVFGVPRVVKILERRHSSLTISV